MSAAEAPGGVVPHPLAGRTVRIKQGVMDPIQEQVVGGAEYRVEDSWLNIAGKSWQVCDGVIGAMHYGVRAAFNALPLDDEVLYGHIGSFGHLVHVSEIES